MVKLILITHGNFGESLLTTASEICCCSQKSITALSVSGKINLDELETKIKKSFTEEGTLIMVDTFGGTSSNIALKCSAENSKVSVVCGVNLNMVLSALNNQDKLNLADLTIKVITDGKKAILDATELIKK
jgi:mannose/fructose-specific phosphotransferase system component IIA